MKTGFEDLDEALKLDNGDVVILGSRPSMGKSTLLRQIASHHAQNKGKVIIWDEERNPIETWALLIAELAGVERIKMGSVKNIPNIESFLKYLQDNQESGECKLDGLEFQRVVYAVSKIIELDIEISHVKRGENVFDLLESLYKIEESNVLVVIDSIKQIAMSENLSQSIEMIMTKINEIAVRTNITFLIASQLNRKVEERQGHRPMLADLSTSPALTEIPNKIMFILRRDYYDPNDRPLMAEIIIAKNNSGQPGCAMLYFLKEFPKFIRYEPVDYLINPNSEEESNSAFDAFGP